MKDRRLCKYIDTKADSLNFSRLFFIPNQAPFCKRKHLGALRLCSLLISEKGWLQIHGYALLGEVFFHLLDIVIAEVGD